ncbi:hypothetical protein V1512DRAFT_261174 [Lipomyces arxii]|uniref:uncharacterized protein n=1 Tax=Lipomyces arxii TaxID=56418 RepID=UPI0034CD948B
MTEEKQISADEIALYDRQIRLWGMAAQTRMRSANVLLVNIGALANEIAKNIVLAGIGSLTVLDCSTVTALHLGGEFFIEGSDVGLKRAEAAVPRIQKLNPRVSIIADTSDFRELPSEYYSKFNIIVATELQLHDLIKMNEFARQSSIPFYAGGSIGLYGYVFVDLLKHKFTIEREKSNFPAKIGPESNTRSVTDVMVKKDGPKLKEVISKVESYKSLAESLKSDSLTKLRPRTQLKVSPVLPAVKAMWEYYKTSGGDAKPRSPEALARFHNLVLEACRSLGLPAGIASPEFTASFARNIGTELSPVAAILGGVLAQDILNCLGQREQPIQNWVVLDGNTSSCPIYTL